MSFSTLSAFISVFRSPSTLKSTLFEGPVPGLIQVRTATKRGGGSTKNHGSSPGKRLGVKKFSGEYVKAGNIILRQRGTEWHPGQHVGMGKDHTLYALEPGYIRFYRIPRKPRSVLPGSTSLPTPLSSSPLSTDTTETTKGTPAISRRTVKMCGVVLRPDEQLPRDELAEGRSRRFGLVELGTFNEEVEAFSQEKREGIRQLKEFIKFGEVELDRQEGRGRKVDEGLLREALEQAEGPSRVSQ